MSSEELINRIKMLEERNKSLQLQLNGVQNENDRLRKRYDTAVSLITDNGRYSVSDVEDEISRSIENSTLDNISVESDDDQTNMSIRRSEDTDNDKFNQGQSRKSSQIRDELFPANSRKRRLKSMENALEDSELANPDKKNVSRLSDLLSPNGNQENSNDNYQIQPDDELENPDRTNTNGRVGKPRRLRDILSPNGNQENSNDNYQIEPDDELESDYEIEPDDELENPNKTNTNGRAGKPRRLRDILFPNGNQENSNDNYQIEPDDELENPDRTNTNGRTRKVSELRYKIFPWQKKRKKAMENEGKTVSTDDLEDINRYATISRNKKKKKIVLPVQRPIEKIDYKPKHLRKSNKIQKIRESKFFKNIKALMKKKIVKIIAAVLIAPVLVGGALLLTKLPHKSNNEDLKSNNDTSRVEIENSEVPSTKVANEVGVSASDVIDSIDKEDKDSYNLKTGSGNEYKESKDEYSVNINYDIGDPVVYGGTYIYKTSMDAANDTNRYTPMYPSSDEREISLIRLVSPDGSEKITIDINNKEKKQQLEQQGWTVESYNMSNQTRGIEHEGWTSGKSFK